jgi:hypothetical protein
MTNSQTKNSWQLLDEVGKSITKATGWSMYITSPDYIDVQRVKDELLKAKNLLNQLKSQMIKESKKEIEKIENEQFFNN